MTWREEQHPRDADGQFTESWASRIANAYAWGSHLGTPRYGTLNAGLRTSSDLDPQSERLRDELDQVIAASAPLEQPITVHRVFSSRQAQQDLQALVQRADRVWVDPGFQSTSTDPNIAEDFAIGENLVELQIRLPRGARVLDVDAALNDPDAFSQREMLLARGTRLKLDTARWRGDRLVVTADWMGS